MTGLIRKIVNNPYILLISLVCGFVGAYYTVRYTDTSTKKTPIFNLSVVDTSRKLKPGGNKADTIGKVIVRTINQSTDKIDSAKNNRLVFEVHNLTPAIVKETNTSTKNEPIKVHIPSPKAGYGVLAIRSHCNYLNQNPTVFVSRADTDDFEDKGRLSSNYDSTRKMATTFIQELPKGMYKIKLDYGQSGLAEFAVKILDNKLTMYDYTKTNQFGDGGRQIVFITHYPRTEWEVTLDDVYRGRAVLEPGKGIYFTVQGFSHSFIFRAVKPDSKGPTEDIIKGSIGIPEGTRSYQPIE